MADAPHSHPVAPQDQTLYKRVFGLLFLGEFHAAVWSRICISERAFVYSACELF